MRFDAKYMVEDAASRLVERPRLAHPWLDTKGKRLIATDGHMMAIVPVEVEGADRDGAIPGAALAEARRVAWKSRQHKVTPSPRVRAGKKLLDTGGALYRRPPVDDFPVNAAEALPKFSPGEVGTLTFGVDVRLLLRLARAMGSRRNEVKLALTVAIPSPGKQVLDPILVRCWSDDKATGVVMPCNIDVAHESKPRMRSPAPATKNAAGVAGR